MSVTKATRKSSRKSMLSRNKRRKARTPSAIFKGTVFIPMNRTAKRMQASEQVHAEGTSVRQQAKQKRKDLTKAARRAARTARKETQKAMRA